MRKHFATAVSNLFVRLIAVSVLVLLSMPSGLPALVNASTGAGDPVSAMQAALALYVQTLHLPYNAILIDHYVRGNWAYGNAGYTYRDTGRLVPTESFVVLAKREQNGTWRALAPSQETASEYNQWLNEIPSDLISDTVFLYVPEERPELTAVATATGYRLPWANGWRATKLQGPYEGTHYDHGIAYWAVDFDLWGSDWGADRQASSWVAAAKAGVVVYVKDLDWGHDSWKNANMVVIGHGTPDSQGQYPEYSWYVHLATGSVPSYVRPGWSVEAGAIIGQEGDNGLSTGVHLHFMVSDWFPPAFMWKEEDARGTAPWPVELVGDSWRHHAIPVQFEETDIDSWPDNEERTSANHVSTDGGVVLYWDADYQGPAIRYDQGNVNRRCSFESSSGKFLCNVPEFLNDRISSIQVNPQGQIFTKLHQDANGGGYSRGWWWTEANFDNDYYDAESAFGQLMRPLNDSISSLFIDCNPCGNNTVSANGSSATLQNLNLDPDPPLPLCGGAPTPPTTDSATFLSDVTLLDGSAVSPGQALVKTWRVRNSGTSTWDGYKLIFLQGDQMGGTSPVNLPTVPPGQKVDISVSLRAPTIPGNKVGYWQIVNRDGVHVPGGRLWVNINVVTSTSGDHIAAFSADPPSPSSASTVRLYARVNWWSQFRAMRVKVDNQIIGETAASEYTFDWNTESVSRGDHTLVLEVADQTDTSWSRPERRVMGYTLQGTPGPANRAPDRPTLERPYNWYVTIGNPPQLCADPANDPDGDPVQYYFETQASVGNANSGWRNDRCWTPPSSLAPGTYEWRVKAGDNRGAESGWSDAWHYSVESSGVEINQLYFEPLDPKQEQVRIRACTTGHAGVNISLSVRVNTATDGSENGEWRIIKELGVPCFNEIDAPVWNTLEYGDGVHRVRVVATAIEPAASDVRDELYTLNHRRPASPRLLAPVPPSGNIRDPIYLKSRTVTFRWEPTIRAHNYTLHIGTNPSPQDDPNPVFRQTFDSSTFQHTVTFGQDYPTLYWQVTATNDVGTNASGDQLFGIDRVAPSCAIQALPAVTYESVFQVNWSGSDNLAGIRTFDIQYLDSDRGTWSDWLIGIPVAKTYELFTGQPGHTYGFRCRATDNANKTGSYPTSSDTSIRVDPAARPPTPWWNSAYSRKRNIVILNNMTDIALPAGYPVRLHFDDNTTPTAAEIYKASLSTPKCNDLRIVYNDSTELDRAVLNCISSTLDIWFRTQVAIPAGTSDSTSHQLYYGNSNPGTPPGSLGTVFYPTVDSHTRVALYAQEGNGSIAYDSSGWENHGTVAPDGYWTEGKWGHAIAFPTTYGRAIYLGNKSSLNLGTLTVEGWFKVEPPYGWPWLASQMGGECGNAGEDTWLFQYREKRLHLALYGPSYGKGEDTPDFLSSWAVGWHHYAFTFDGNVAKIYFDGILRHTFTTGFPLRLTNATTEFGGGECDHRVSGRMQNMAISDIVRTDFSYGAFAAITNEPTAAAGSPIAPPITGIPDLAVLSLTTYPNPGGGVLVQTVVRNQGNVSTQNGFFTDLYADHLPTGAGDYTGSVHFWVASPIEAGRSITLTTAITNLSGIAGMNAQGTGAASEVNSTLYAQVDSTGAVSETDNLNNISSGAQVCIASADAYESDDSATTAKPIALGTSQTHNFHSPGDQDWVKFIAEGGVTYTIQTFNLGLAADTYLYLYDTDAMTLLAANDDHGGSLASRLDWTAPTTGTYYVLVKHWNPNVGGCGTTYELRVGLVPKEVFLPLVLRNYP